MALAQEPLEGCDRETKRRTAALEEVGLAGSAARLRALLRQGAARDIVLWASGPLNVTSALFLCLSFSCWDMNDNTALWWVIKGPVVGSIMVSVLGTRSREKMVAWPKRHNRRVNEEVTTETRLLLFRDCIVILNMAIHVIWLFC